MCSIVLQEPVDAEPGVPEAGVGVGHFFGPRGSTVFGRRVENLRHIIGSCPSEELPHADNTVDRSDQLGPLLEILERSVSGTNTEIAHAFHCTDEWIFQGLAREHKATEQPVVFVFVDAPEPVEIGKVGEVRPELPFKLNYDGFVRCGGVEDQAGAAKTSN
jgi:hypothetical protein